MATKWRRTSMGRAHHGGGRTAVVALILSALTALRWRGLASRQGEVEGKCLGGRSSRGGEKW
jgi:hypothetical protein